jgi:hypothetical protein
MAKASFLAPNTLHHKWNCFSDTACRGKAKVMAAALLSVHSQLGGTPENLASYLFESNRRKMVLEGGVEPPQAIENTQLIDFIEKAKRQKRPTRRIWARTGHTEKRPVGQLGGRMVIALLSSTLTPRISLFTSARRCARSSPPPTP